MISSNQAVEQYSQSRNVTSLVRPVQKCCACHYTDWTSVNCLLVHVVIFHRFLVYAGHREVLGLVIKCENDCEWEGEIRALDQHKSTCLHVLVACPRGCDVGSVLRGDLQSHLQDSCSERDYKCPHCHEIGRYSERVTSHLQDCAVVPTKCPNEGCEEMLCSSLILLHVATDCPLTVLQCKYSEAGCKVQLPRRELEVHENDDRVHLSWS